MPANDNPVIFHDYFGIRGGGERLVLTLAEALRGELVFGYRSAESYPDDMFPPMVRDLGLPAALRRPGMRAAVLAARFALERRRAERYALRIFSGAASPFAAPDTGAGGRSILYCHTPPRFLYDQRQRAMPQRGTPLGLLRRAAMARYQAGYEAAIGRMDVIVANSRHVQRRIRTYLERPSVVIYPPVDTDRFVWRGEGGYYLSTARLSEMKRVDRIVAAFLEMPDKQLVVASGGELHEPLRRLAADAPNIRFTGWIGDDRLRDLMGNAIATIYVPVAEDFGISPVESMAAGKPVISVAEGGVLETVLPEETGILLRPDFATAELVEAVERLTPGRAAAMRGACEAQAARFARRHFVAAMRELLSSGR